MTVSVGVSLERDNALQDAKDIIDERGMDITLNVISEESQVSRDLYNSIKKRTPTGISLKAFPVIFNPTQKQLEKAGISLIVDCIITLATKDLTLNSLTIEDLDSIRSYVTIPDGGDYLIEAIARVNHFANTFLNVNLGLKLKS